MVTRQALLAASFEPSSAPGGARPDRLQRAPPRIFWRMLSPSTRAVGSGSPGNALPGGGATQNGGRRRRSGSGGRPRLRPPEDGDGEEPAGRVCARRPSRADVIRARATVPGPGPPHSGGDPGAAWPLGGQVTSSGPLSRWGALPPPPPPSRGLSRRLRRVLRQPPPAPRGRAPRAFPRPALVAQRW